MPISININTPVQSVSFNIEETKSPENFAAAKHLYNPSAREGVARSLESRVQDLSAKLEELSSGEMDAEIQDCEKELVALLAKVRSVKFANAFPLVYELDENASEPLDEEKNV